MDKEEIQEYVEKAKSESPQRNFRQTVEFIINLKDLNMKDPDDQVDFFVRLPNDMDMERKICAFVGPELEDEAEEHCDEVIPQSNFDSIEPKEAKNLAKEYDYFVAQANIMPKVASTFGKYLGPQGKMPNPDAGSVVPPNADLAPLYEKLQNTVRVEAKDDPVVHVIVGKEDLDDEKLADNAWYIFDQLVHKLPKENNNIKDSYIKLTMGPPVKMS